MGKYLKFLIIFNLVIFLTAFTKEKEVDIKKLSESIGNIIGNNLEELGVELDLKKMIKGIKKGSKNQKSPMSSDQLLEALAEVQIKKNDLKALKNLKIAEEFLVNNLKDKTIIQIEDQKLQYKILKNGKNQKVESYHTPIVKICGRYLDGKIFTNKEDSINLNETLPALKKAIVGMNLYEKRKVFMHPELIFTKNPPHLNSLVIFDIEIINLDAKKDPLSEIANNKKVF